MTTHNFNSPVQVQAKRRRFDRYVLDLDRGSLLFDGNEIALRPKTFAVLHYLVDNCGRLVSKDELFAAVWPNIAVTDDALVQSIGELRRALGDDGARLIRTIPRRGYRFESDVSAVVELGRPALGRGRIGWGCVARCHPLVDARRAHQVIRRAGCRGRARGNAVGRCWNRLEIFERSGIRQSIRDQKPRDGRETRDRHSPLRESGW